MNRSAHFELFNRPFKQKQQQNDWLQKTKQKALSYHVSWRPHVLSTVDVVLNGSVWMPAD